MAEKKRKPRLWYSRRGDRIRGPFPAGLISRYIILGRIHGEDELSNDKVNWVPYQRVKKLMPSRYVHLGDPDEQQDLRMVRMREDERTGLDQRLGGADVPSERRASDRRGPESDESVAHREVRRSLGKRGGTSKLSYALRVCALILFLGSLVSVVVYLGSDEEIALADCAAPAGAGVNWSNCQLNGISLPGADLSSSVMRSAKLPNANLRGVVLVQGDLSYIDLSLSDMRAANLLKASLVGANLRRVDLRQANLTEADLSYANLRGADLRDANLSGAKLSKTIWVDGRVCGPASIARCEP